MHTPVDSVNSPMSDWEADFGSWDVVREPIAQVSQVLEIIENVRKISCTTWVNKNQCKRLADRFSVIAGVLMGLVVDKNAVDDNVLDGGGGGDGNSSKDYAAFHELLTVLRKGEALVSYYRAWMGIMSAVSRTDNREAFQEIHEELDTLHSQFRFEELDDKYIGSASGGERIAMLTEDADEDLKEMSKNLEELSRMQEDPTQVSMDKPETLDMEKLKQVVLEKSKPVGEDGKLPIYLSIDVTDLETDAPIRVYERKSSQDPAEKDGWAVVLNGRWLGCEFAIKVFQSGDQSDWNKEQLMKEVGALVELRHPHVIQLVGFGQDSEKCVLLMELMGGDLRDFMNQKLESAPEPKPRPFTRCEELDIITQIAKGMYYLHTQQYAHGDLKCSNILVKKSGDYLEVKIGDLRNAIKLDKDWDQTAFDQARLTKRPRWTAPEALKHVGGVKPSPHSLQKSDVYSFAMTCYEVVTGKYPFDGIYKAALFKQIEAGIMPELPGELDDNLKGLISSCWDSDPNNRPSFENICYVLDYIRSKKPAVGINKSSGKDVVLRLFRQIPPVLGTVTGLLHRVRGKEPNILSPAHETSTWDVQNIGHEFERTDSILSFAEHLRIKPSELNKLRRIGRGCSAKVYEATWLGCRFAVKKFKPKSNFKALVLELKFLITLRHPYIAQLVGLAFGSEQECMIVMELMDCHLRELIELKKRTRSQILKPQEAAVPFDLHDAVLIIRKVALGMAFLHSRGVMHRDLKSLNVLIQKYPGHIDVKIADFGLSRYISESETHGDYIGVGTGYWRAPEILPLPAADRSGKPNLRAIDVYSFGVLCYEVLTGISPFSELEKLSFYDKVIEGYRPTLPPDLYPDLKVLIQRCWHGDPEQRPDFTYICGEVLRIQQALSSST